MNPTTGTSSLLAFSSMIIPLGILGILMCSKLFRAGASRECARTKKAVSRTFTHTREPGNPATAEDSASQDTSSAGSDDSATEALHNALALCFTHDPHEGSAPR